MEKLKERAKNTAQWLIRREGYLKVAHIDKVIENDLETQRRITTKKAVDWFCNHNCGATPCIHYCPTVVELVSSIENEE